MPRPLAPTLLLLASCGQRWSTLDDCYELSPGAQADECWAANAAELFRRDAAQGEQVVAERVQDQRVRDFIWLTVTREVDPSSYKYCDKIVENALAERCRVLVSRPHLHRELLKGEQGRPDRAGAGGGPAPGSSGQTPPPPSGGE